MNRHLQKMCNSGSFMEICKIIESKTTKPNHNYKDMTLTTTDLDHLKQFTISNILKTLNSDSKIPEPLIKLSVLLGEDHISLVRSVVCNFVVSRKSADISQFIQQNFQNPSSLRKIFDFLEQTADNVSNLYSNTPIDWNIDLKLVNRSLVMIKQILCEYFFSSEVMPDSYSAGIVYTINFERKLENFFNNKKCCISPAGNTDDDSAVSYNQSNLSECIHKRMLSRVCVPYIEIFFEQCLSKNSDVSPQQSIIEKNIIKSYIEFFKQLEYAYGIALYIDDREAYIKLVTIVDRCLFNLIRQTKIEDSPAKMIVVISTILYIQHVLEEFVNNVSLRHPIEFQLVSMEASRKLERQQAIKIEHEFNNNFSGNVLDF
ncbi:uncharacterized protein VICG_00100 [Vittaforma corneae ATCC 50505]|uniref:Uncharacterized protein n=1 Tax=Vittaforma corneae (strain ATCC 50505) TaxID=993615 RepID=L2GQJ0_VITCO|nr:uncharacterized protein VICG_00100 [Vittaforma corneae ATCC 50505]ELA42785.1 hypothetical protein VICG_00100 [Vittaforma corneae ATCC 50505]